MPLRSIDELAGSYHKAFGFQLQKCTNLYECINTHSLDLGKRSFLLQTSQSVFLL